MDHDIFAIGWVEKEVYVVHFQPGMFIFINANAKYETVLIKEVAVYFRGIYTKENFILHHQVDHIFCLRVFSQVENGAIIETQTIAVDKVIGYNFAIIRKF
jgi:hypothetical protein